MTNFFGQDTLESVRGQENAQTLQFFPTFALWLGANVVVTTIFTGMLIVPAINFIYAMIIVAIGSVVGIVPLVLVGVMGQETGLTTMVLARAAFGRKGSFLPAGLNVLTLIAWGWVQARLAGLSLNYAINYSTGFSSLSLCTIFCEGLVVLITLTGHRGIETAEKFVASAMLIFAFVVFGALAWHYNLGHLVTMPSQGGTSVGIAFDMVIATAFSWIPLAADYNRHCKSRRIAFFGTWSGYVVATVIAMGLGAAASGLSVALGHEPTYDPTKLLSSFGLGLPAALVIFFSVLTTNVMVVYSATLSWMSIRQKSSFWKSALIIGLITVFGALIPGILKEFQNFLLIIGSMFIPAFSVIIVDYFLLNESSKKYTNELLVVNYHELIKFDFIALVSYSLGALLALYWNWVSPLSIGSSLPVFLITGASYWIGKTVYNVVSGNSISGGRSK